MIVAHMTFTCLSFTQQQLAKCLHSYILWTRLPKTRCLFGYMWLPLSC